MAFSYEAMVVCRTRRIRLSKIVSSAGATPGGRPRVSTSVHLAGRRPTGEGAVTVADGDGGAVVAASSCLVETPAASWF